MLFTGVCDQGSWCGCGMMLHAAGRIRHVIFVWLTLQMMAGKFMNRTGPCILEDMKLNRTNKLLWRHYAAGMTIEVVIAVVRGGDGW